MLLGARLLCLEGVVAILSSRTRPISFGAERGFLSQGQMGRSGGQSTSGAQIGLEVVRYLLIGVIVFCMGAVLFATYDMNLENANGTGSLYPWGSDAQKGQLHQNGQTTSTT